MVEIKRCYEISPANTSFFRGWQGHKIEKKWFYCLEGTLKIQLVKIDDFERPSPELLPITIILEAEMPEVLEVPRGYATGIRALAENSRLMVFSDSSLEASKADDYRFPSTMWAADL
jgi:dTDP-4-dehydrorhamnose 3,5-epimerase